MACTEKLVFIRQNLPVIFLKFIKYLFTSAIKYCIIYIGFLYAIRIQ